MTDCPRWISSPAISPTIRIRLSESMKVSSTTCDGRAATCRYGLSDRAAAAPLGADAINHHGHDKGKPGQRGDHPEDDHPYAVRSACGFATGLAADAVLIRPLPYLKQPRPRVSVPARADSPAQPSPTAGDCLAKTGARKPKFPVTAIR
jgi:hypothetical protein